MLPLLPTEKRFNSVILVYIIDEISVLDVKHIGFYKIFLIFGHITNHT